MQTCWTSYCWTIIWLRYVALCCGQYHQMWQRRPAKSLTTVGSETRPWLKPRCNAANWPDRMGQDVLGTRIYFASLGCKTCASAPGIMPSFGRLRVLLVCYCPLLPELTWTCHMFLFCWSCTGQSWLVWAQAALVPGQTLEPVVGRFLLCPAASITWFQHISTVSGCEWSSAIVFNLVD